MAREKGPEIERKFDFLVNLPVGFHYDDRQGANELLSNYISKEKLSTVMKELGESLKGNTNYKIEAFESTRQPGKYRIVLSNVETEVVSRFRTQQSSQSNILNQLNKSSTDKKFQALLDLPGNFTYYKETEGFIGNFRKEDSLDKVKKFASDNQYSIQSVPGPFGEVYVMLRPTVSKIEKELVDKFKAKEDRYVEEAKWGFIPPKEWRNLEDTKKAAAEQTLNDLNQSDVLKNLDIKFKYDSDSSLTSVLRLPTNPDNISRAITHLDGVRKIAQKHHSELTYTKLQDGTFLLRVSEVSPLSANKVGTQNQQGYRGNFDDLVFDIQSRLNEAKTATRAQEPHSQERDAKNREIGDSIRESFKKVDDYLKQREGETSNLSWLRGFSKQDYEARQESWGKIKAEAQKFYSEPDLDKFTRFIETEADKFDKKGSWHRHQYSDSLRKLVQALKTENPYEKDDPKVEKGKAIVISDIANEYMEEASQQTKGLR